LANEFFSNIDLIQIVRRTQTVVILMNTLKKYWITLPSGYIEEEGEEEERENAQNKSPSKNNNTNFDRSAIVHVRTCILKLVYNFTFLCCEGSEERDDELQCIFNFIATTNEVFLRNFFIFGDFFLVRLMSGKEMDKIFNILGVNGGLEIHFCCQIFGIKKQILGRFIFLSEWRGSGEFC